MHRHTKLDILKGALLLEYRGKALYASAVKTTEIPEVKSLFILLKDEEEKHIGALKKFMSQIRKGVEASESLELEESSPVKFNPVLSKDIVEKVHGAGYEAAVISAALDFEKKAVKFYSEQALKAESEGEKSLYKWLSDWEIGHMQMLAGLDSELKEKIWYDNRFWPLD